MPGVALLCGALLAGAVQAAAPEKKAVDRKAAEGKPKQAAGTDFTGDLAANLTHVGKQLVSLAEATPADKFSWRPTDEVRRMSEVYMHVAAANVLLPSLLGAAPPEGVTIPEKPFTLTRKWEAEVTAKDEVVARLKESFEYAARAVRSIPAKEHDRQVDVFGFPASKRAYLMILMNHAHEHLGQAVAYARTVGVVPPWTAERQAAAAGGR
jgi:uncharacterized damage-inducible protein DinB